MRAGKIAGANVELGVLVGGDVGAAAGGRGVLHAFREVGDRGRRCTSDWILSEDERRAIAPAATA